ncbi:hypothetical protein [Mycobacterium intracellulare]|uniref:hypothetical protein n=1 Tax=Mycobacterium intracellulare TaxID=1767 RepID=UPI000BAAD67D|nr:hypothetical protein [Mycobacterium intracellulare]ASW84789.1 hypothetical protein CKJ61_07700 [Mycobacterium intracellulare]
MKLRQAADGFGFDTRVTPEEMEAIEEAAREAGKSVEDLCADIIEDRFRRLDPSMPISMDRRRRESDSGPTP